MKVRAKRRLEVLICALLLGCFIFVGGTSAYAECEVWLGGMPAGFKIDNIGATVIGVNDVVSKEGVISPSGEAGIKAGDIILSIDSCSVNSAADVEKILSSYDGNGVAVVFEREGEVLVRIVYPVADVAGKYRLGVFLRDDITGIGTITYIKDDLSFGALGHPVADQSGKTVKINSGEVFRCNIIGVNKGSRGKAGEIRGYFPEDKKTGIIEKNSEKGIFGKLSDGSITDGTRKIGTGRAKPGKAVIYTTICGSMPKEYEISIVKSDPKAAENKNLVIKVTDERLIEETAGILQGMSGSPIVQGGKLVGAITHVFLSDPERGYGISIENMMKE